MSCVNSTLFKSGTYERLNQSLKFRKTTAIAVYFTLGYQNCLPRGPRKMVYYSALAERPICLLKLILKVGLKVILYHPLPP